MKTLNIKSKRIQLRTLLEIKRNISEHQTVAAFAYHEKIYTFYNIQTPPIL